MSGLSPKYRRQAAGETGVADKARRAQKAREESLGHTLWISRL